MLAEIFGDDPPREPERVPLSLVHVWGAALGSRQET